METMKGERKPDIQKIQNRSGTAVAAIGYNGQCLKTLHIHISEQMFDISLL